MTQIPQVLCPVAPALAISALIGLMAAAPTMARQRFKVGDIVEVTHYTPGRYAPRVKDELGTEALFRRIVGRRYRIKGFDEYGHIELHPSRKDWIWIKPDDVRLASRKKKSE